MGVIFVAGIYGVGKTTLCNELSLVLGIPHFSASELISTYNGEIYGANKSVNSVNNNQDILVEQVKRLLKNYDTIILSGHFVIITQGKICCVPQNTFTNLSLSKILLLEADCNRIIQNLVKRDNKIYDDKIIKELCLNERQLAMEVAERLVIPFIKYDMTFSDKDAKGVVKLLKGENL